jgi:hypothetical protein
MLVLLGLVGVLMYYMRCGEGFGIAPGGGDGTGSRSEAERVDRGTDESPADVRPAVGESARPPRRCRLRLDASGLTLEGRPSTIDEAVDACKRSGGAELTPTGDAVYGELQKVRQALDRAGVEVFVRDTTTAPGK